MMAGQPYLLRIIGFGFSRPKNRVPGLDVAGTVVEVGSAVTRFAMGDEVFGISRGSFAEYAAVREDKLAPKPANLTFEQAAVVPISAGTALQALTDAGRVEAGQRVLVIGASGGVGSYRGAAGQGIRRRSHRCVQHREARLRDVSRCRPRHRLHLSRTSPTAPPGTTSSSTSPATRRCPDYERHSRRTGTLVIVGGEEGGRWTGGFGRSLRAPLLSLFVRAAVDHARQQGTSQRPGAAHRPHRGRQGEAEHRRQSTLWSVSREAMLHLEAAHVRGKVAIVI